ncbi:hypothetical protein LCGC14_2897190, partial [marine sediment metagenome]
MAKVYYVEEEAAEKLGVAIEKLADLAREVTVDQADPDYEIVEAPPRVEYEAQAFG